MKANFVAKTFSSSVQVTSTLAYPLQSHHHHPLCTSDSRAVGSSSLGIRHWIGEFFHPVRSSSQHRLVSVHVPLLGRLDSLVLTAHVLDKFCKMDLPVGLLQVPMHLVCEVFVQMEFDQLKYSIDLREARRESVIHTHARTGTQRCILLQRVLTSCCC